MKQKYDDVFAEILNVTDNGLTALKVMEVLKERGIVEGDPSKKIMWLFNFEGGGWNSVMAVTAHEAVRVIKKEYKDSPNLTPIFSSVRPSTDADYQANLRNFD